MWILAGAVVTASILGSMHCVGMCGPLAIWASGAADNSSEKSSSNRIVATTTLYHFGRLLTYALTGLIAGLIGQLADFGGQVLGVQLAAARIVGTAMILIGAGRLMQLVVARRRAGDPSAVVAKSLQPSPITKLLISLRPHVFALPIKMRALATGLLTALLPCGWLYLFALVAAGTGNWMMGPVVMVAFWLGTVPALVGVVTGTRMLAGKFRRVVPTAAAILLIVAGGYTASGRGFANLNSLADIHVPHLQTVRGEGGEVVETENAVSVQGDVASELTHNLDDILKTPLPCCEVKKVQASH
jgi:uncharacterized protein